MDKTKIVELETASDRQLARKLVILFRKMTIEEIAVNMVDINERAASNLLDWLDPK